MTANAKCPVCSMRLTTTSCPRCGAEYQGGQWRMPTTPENPNPNLKFSNSKKWPEIFYVSAESPAADPGNTPEMS
ncbi:MAG TPA: hypothetical protein VGG62_12270 [Terracidiphilus sp.]